MVRLLTFRRCIRGAEGKVERDIDKVSWVSSLNITERERVSNMGVLNQSMLPAHQPRTKSGYTALQSVEEEKCVVVYKVMACSFYS